MRAGQKIIEGLKAALGYARCRHEFTYWEEVVHYGDARMHMPRTWRRKCVNCQGMETKYSRTEPHN